MAKNASGISVESFIQNNSRRASISSGNSAQNLRIHDLFKACDSQGKGLIGPDEFRDLCHRFGISDADSSVIFLDLDHDGDGQIDFEDFSHGFSDFLTPGSRRGSFQVNLIEGKTAIQQLMEMEKKHASAKTAWKHFMHNVGPTNITPFMNQKNCGEQLYGIVEDLRNEKSPDVTTKLEKALSTLISDVQTLHEEYKTLENTFRKEREAHAIQIAALGEEMDNQLAKAEARAKLEARQEAQKQMDTERKKISVEMESKLGDLTAQLRTFEKVEEWLSEEEAREKFRTSDESSRRIETESENRKLRSALVEAQTKATLLQSQLTQKRNEYLDLYHALHSEKVAATEYRNQCDLMQNHLSILSEANRVLSDANDCFSTTTSLPVSMGQNQMHEEMSCQNSLTSCHNLAHFSEEDEVIERERRHMPNSPASNDSKRSFSLSTMASKNGMASVDTDKDSGRETLFDELRAEGDSSPLPSGVWSSGMSTSADDCPLHPSRLSLTPSPIPMPRGLPSTGSLPRNVNAMKLIRAVPQRTFKVILAGDAAVGKTSFIERVCYGHFATHLSSTIGVDFRMKTIEIDGNCIALQLWDTAGQERFRSLTKSYFRRADGVILMYDVTNERTFVSIRHWIQNVEEGAGRKVPIVLCGNKVDLRDGLYKGITCVSHEEGNKLGRQCGAFFIEVSPKTGYNVLEALILLTREMSTMEDADLQSSLKLNPENGEEANKRKACCSSSSTNAKTDG